MFAPLGARRLVATARAFGFNQPPPNIPAAKPSTISPPAQLRDSLAVGAAAIGQDRDLATPLQMASVAATIGLDGRHVQPRITTIDPIRSTGAASQGRPPGPGDDARRRALRHRPPRPSRASRSPAKPARPSCAPTPPTPPDADAWFAAFAPAHHPTVAVAVMLVGAGFGGATAAPIAKDVLQAALPGS